MTRPPLLPSALTFREPVDEETRLANHGCMWVNYALSLETLVQSLVNALDDTQGRLTDQKKCTDECCEDTYAVLAYAAELGFKPTEEPRK